MLKINISRIACTLLVANLILVGANTPASARHDKPVSTAPTHNPPTISSPVVVGPPFTTPPPSTPPPASTFKIVPWLCNGDSVTYSNGNLIINSGRSNGPDGTVTAGFQLYSGTRNNLIPFEPGQLTLTISGAQPGDTYEIFAANVSSHRIAFPEFADALTNNTIAIDFKAPSPQKQKLTYILFGINSNGHPVQISNISFNGSALPVDLTHTDNCNDVMTIQGSRH